MDNTDFAQLSELAIQYIYDAIEAADSDYELDCDILDGILNIELPNGGQYIINKHNASKQIWLSSPVSGASHFLYKEDSKQWIDSKGNNLMETIAAELKQQVDIELW
jgi:frataxin